MVGNACTHTAELEYIQNVLQTYAHFNHWKVLFDVTAGIEKCMVHSRDDRFMFLFIGFQCQRLQKMEWRL